MKRGRPPLPLGEGRGEGSIHRSNIVGCKKAGKYFFTKQLALLLARLPSPRPSPRGRGGSPEFVGIKSFVGQ